MRCLLAILLACGLAGSATASEDQAALVAGLPVQHEGRVKPLASFARVWLLAVHTRARPKLDEGPESATAWLMELLCDQQAAFARPVFTERNPAVIEAIGLPPRPDFAYSFNQLAGALNQHGELIAQLQERPEDALDVTERELLRLVDVVQAYYQLGQSLTVLLPLLEPGAELAAELGVEPGRRYSFLDLRRLSGPLALVVESARDTAPDDLSPLERQALSLARDMRALEQHAGFMLAILPPHEGDTWLHPWELPRLVDPCAVELIAGWQAIAEAWRQADETALSSAVARLEGALPSSVDRSRLAMEVSYLHSGWYNWAKAAYILTLFLLGLAMLGDWRWPRLAALASFGLALTLQAVGIAMRVWILERPPVTTLYESIIFVGAVSALGCVVWELLRRDGLAVFNGAIIALILLFVGDAYADDGDTMGMLQAVLNSRFWLTTHVLTIAIGYSIALIAGLAGHCYLVSAIVWPGRRERLRSLEGAMHGISLVALFFVLVGTILGGIWADQSWGRFWGWDPKENGAMWIVLWLLMLFHMRLAGQCPALLYAAGLVVLNVVVALAWFGVNLLGVGLHSYGFTDSIVRNLMLFVVGEIALAAALWLVARARLAAQSPR